MSSPVHPPRLALRFVVTLIVLTPLALAIPHLFSCESMYGPSATAVGGATSPSSKEAGGGPGDGLGIDLLWRKGLSVAGAEAGWGKQLLRTCVQQKAAYYQSHDRDSAG